MKKSVVITGASTGLGHSLTKEFINRGYQVFGSVRKEADAVSLKKEFGGEFEPLLMDVTDYPSIEKAAKMVATHLGTTRLTGLVNNAGIVKGGPLLHLPIEDLKYQFEVNLFGQIKVIQAFAPMLGTDPNFAGPPSRIIQMSSVAGKIGMPFLGPYSSSKHALEGISESLRRELLLYNIDVVIIAPGAVKTPIWNKGEEQGLGNYGDTPYAKPMNSFQKVFVKKAINKALDVEDVSKKIVTIFESNRPKTRYALVSQWLTNWILPQLLPPRFIDRHIGKRIGLLKS